MPFDPTKPQNGEVVDADVLRGQLTALNDQITGEKARVDAAFAALDWSNGAPRLPDYTTIANPVAGNIAFDYVNQRPGVYASGDWLWLG